MRNVPEALQVADRYDNWAAEQGYSEANHYIITRYKHGLKNIGFHFDKPRDIRPGSLITIVKLGPVGRPFQLRWLGEKDPFFNQVLPPGAALVMTLEANLQTQHCVPLAPNCHMQTGSIVLRTIDTIVTTAEIQKKIEAGKRKRKRDEENKQKKKKKQVDVEVIEISSDEE